MKVVNPATGHAVREVEETPAADLPKLLDRAREAQVHWKKVPLEHRLSCLEKFQLALRENKEALAHDLTTEVGKPLTEARNEVEGAADKMDFFLKHSAEILSPKEFIPGPQTREILEYDPLGIVGVISAWNYPLLVGINHYVPALIAGNGVLYKPSEWATLTGLNIARLLELAGIPKNVFQCLVGGPALGRSLVDLPLDGFFFTGSQRTGLAIAETIRSRLVPLGLELGGKDPLYVTEDVDIESAAADAIDGVFYNNGQSCCSVERLYIHQDIYDEFLERFLVNSRALKVGDPLQEATTQGPLTRKDQLAYLEKQVADALEKGARLLLGGKRLPGPGYFFEPTVLSETDHQMSVMCEESFGPIIGIMKVSNDEEAIRLMNDTDYGLTAAIFTRDLERGKAILQTLDTGTGYLNCCDRVSGYSPWSGRGQSGLGTTLSKHGIFAMVNPKAYHLRD